MDRVVHKRLSKGGTVGIPAALRKEMGIQGGDAMELQITEDNKIIVRTYQLRCCFCNVDNTGIEVHDFNGKGICESCLEKIIKRLGGKKNGEANRITADEQ